MVRRILASVLGVVVIGVSWLGAPSSVAAATLGAVTFPAGSSTFTEVGHIDFNAAGRSCAGASGYSNNMHLHPGSNVWPPASNYYSYRTSDWGDLHGQVWSGGPYGCRMGVSANVLMRWRFDPVAGTVYRFTFDYAVNTGSSYQGISVSWINASGTLVGTIQAAQTVPAGGSNNFTTTSTAPSGAIGIEWQSHHGTTYQKYIEVEGEEAPENEGCAGVGSLDSGAIVGSPAPDWGIYWNAEREACLSAYLGWQTVLWIPPPGFPIEPYFVEGQGYCLVDVWAVTQQSAVGRPKVRAYWVDFSGDTVGLIYNYTTATGTATVCKEAPAEAYGIAWVMEADLYQVSHTVRDAEGDDLETYGDGEKPIAGRTRSSVVDHFADCEVPVAGEIPVISDIAEFLIGDSPGFTNPVDYIPYGICLMVAGFKTVVDWLADLPGYIATFVGDAFTVALTAAVGLVGDTIEFLFIPTTLGADWQAFIDTVEAKVPFGWFAQVRDTISAGLAAGSSGLPSASLMGVSVTAPLSTALGALAPWRTLILGGVAIVMVTGCLRWIMAAVGVSPAHQAEGSS